MKPDPYQIVKYPLVTEKSMRLGMFNQYVFEVDKRANKVEIRDAIEEIFNVKVKSVRTMNYKAEMRPYGSRAKKNKARKKAVATLAEGHEIDLNM